jgi:hypothetical protein
MRAAFRSMAVALIGLLCACGGGGQTPFPVESANDTAVIHYTNNACSVTVTVHRDQTAQSTSNCSNWKSTTTTLPQTIVSLLFSDLQAAQPLNALVACPAVDISMSIAWNGQQSPNVGICTGTSTAEQNLVSEIEDIISSFTTAG